MQPRSLWGRVRIPGALRLPRASTVKGRDGVGGADAHARAATWLVGRGCVRGRRRRASLGSALENLRTDGSSRELSTVVGSFRCVFPPHPPW